MGTVSLALIVRDEEKALPRLLESVKDCFDELIVVDTGSADRTKEIAEKFGAKVFDFEWIDDFSAARNFAFSKAKSEFVMWLDADDVVLPQDKERLLALKPTLGGADAYLMAYDYAQDEFGKSIALFQRHRILRMSKGPRWELPIHEHLNIHAGWRVEKTNVTVTHRRSLDALTKDKGRNVRILEKACAKHPENGRLKYYYGRDLYTDGLHEKSIQVLTDFLKAPDWHEHAVQAWYWLALAYLALNRPDDAVGAAIQGIRLDPRWAEYYCVVGQVHYDRGDWKKCIPWFEIAAALPVPDTLATVLTDYYTWMPRDRLCKAFSEIGDFQKGYEWNEAALSYRPWDQRLLGNRNYLEDRLFDRLSHRPVRLNLGSGGKPQSGYRACDFYPGKDIEFRIDQAKLPYRDSTVHAIRSEHALEHSDSHYSAEKTIQEWARVSRYGATLHLMVPDLDQCCEKFLSSPDVPRAEGQRWTEKEWYKYTIYGIQVGQNQEPAQGQYHRTGFTKEQLRRLLTANGYEVKSLSPYDGFGTPSIEVHAVRTGRKPRVAWMLRSMNPDDPSARIRRINPHIHLSGNGIDSRLFPNYHVKDEGATVAMIRDFDVVVFSFFSDYERRVMDKLRLCGVSVVADYNEDLADLHPEVGRCLQSATVIACCSKVLAEKAARFGRTVVIPDAYETA